MHAISAFTIYFRFTFISVFKAKLVVRNAELRPLFHSHETEIKELNRKVVKWERAYTTAGSAVPVKFQPRTLP